MTAMLAPKAIRIIAIVFFIAIAVFYSLTVLNIDFRKTQLLDLAPLPDGSEYFAGAISLYRQGGYSIQIGESHLPPRYPMGYSIAMLPFIALLGNKAILAPFLINQIVGFALIIGLFFYFWLNRQPIAAMIGVGLLATMPAFVVFARAPLSELLSIALLLLALYCFIKGMEKNKPLYFYAGAIALGFCIVVRLQYAFYAPLILAVFLLKERSLSNRLRIFILSGLLLGLAASPMFFYNWKTFGSPFLTGYYFWLSNYKPAQTPFKPDFIDRHVNLLWLEFTLAINRFRTVNLFGIGSYYTPAFFILAVGSVIGYFTFNRRDYFAMLVVILSSILLFHWAAELRLYFPIAVLAVIAIAKTAEWIYTQPFKGKAVVSLLFSLIFLAAMIGFPYKDGYTQATKLSHLWILLNHKASLGVSSLNYEIVSLFKDRFGNDKSLVLSPITPPYVNALLDSNAVCFPSGEQRHFYRWSKDFQLTDDDVIAAIKSAIDDGKRIFYIAPKSAPKEEHQPTPPLARFQWEVRYDDLFGSIYEISSKTLQ